MALEEILSEQGYSVERGAAPEAAQHIYDAHDKALQQSATPENAGLGETIGAEDVAQGVAQGVARKG